MMRRLALALAVAAVLAASGAQASGVNVALAGALGAYDADPLALNLRTATIDLTGVGRDATGLALSWAGYATPGLLALCDEPEQTSDWPGVLQVRIDHPDGGVWEGLAEMLTGEVGEITFLEFYGSGAPDLDFLFAGPVDVHVVNHHGFHDAANEFFLKTLQPRVNIVQTLGASHLSFRVFARLSSRSLYPGLRDIFCTNMHQARETVIGADRVKQSIASAQGNIVVRVAQGGGSYRVIILDDSTEDYRIKSVHGPYMSL